MGVTFCGHDVVVVVVGIFIPTYELQMLQSMNIHSLALQVLVCYSNECMVVQAVLCLV